MSSLSFAVAVAVELCVVCVLIIIGREMKRTKEEKKMFGTTTWMAGGEGRHTHVAVVVAAAFDVLLLRGCGPVCVCS